MPHAAVSSEHRGKAKRLRGSMTRAETLMGCYIKAHRIDGLGFRRQAPIGPYIVEFVCHEARPIVELDGESHDFGKQQLKDGWRDRLLALKGFRTFRFTNKQGMSNLEGVVAAIREAILLAPPSLTLLRKGGGNSTGRQPVLSHKELG